MNSTLKEWVVEIVITLVAAFALLFLLQFVVIKVEVISESMEPSLIKGQQLIINKVAYSFGDPNRGDIIVFKPPEATGASYDFIKRVIGLPGERVSVSEDRVYIINPDGSSFVLDEPFLTDTPLQDFKSSTIPEGHYFVMGDNRNNSGDSRNGWTVPIEDITGQACISYWPLSEFGCAPNHSFSE